MFERVIKKQMKARYLIYLVLFAYVFGSFLGVFVHSAEASKVTLSESFESGTVGYNFSGTWLNVKNYYYPSGGHAPPAGLGVGNVARTGLKGISNVQTAAGYCRGFFNITSGAHVMTEFSFYVKAIASSISGTSFNFLLNWNQYVSTGQAVIILQGGYNSSTKFYYTAAKYGGGTQFIGNFYSTNWTRVSIRWISKDVVTYTVGNKVTTITCLYAPSAAIYNITSIYINGNFNAAGQGYYYDDFSYTHADSFTGESSPSLTCGYNMGNYSSIQQGDMLTNQVFPVNYKYIEQRYEVPVDGTLSGVGLVIDAAQYILDSDVSHYSLKVNGNEVGSPACVYQYSENGYMMFWPFTIILSGERPLFEFCHSTILEQNKYWYLCGTQSEYVNDLSYPRYHSSVSLYDGVFNGNSFPISGSRFLYGLDVIFWYSAFSFINETSPYADLITSSKKVFETFDTIPIYYFISDYTYTNSIQLWKSGVQQTIQGFPLTVTSGDFNGELSFTPFHSGSYQFRLVRNSVIRSTFNFTVSDPVDSDFILAVYPNPCEFNQEVSIGYRFYPDDGAEGFIGISEFPDTINLSDFSEYWLLSANISGNKTFFAQTDMYVSLWKKTGSSYVRMKIKYLKMFSLFDNTINVGYKSIALSDAVPSVSQRIFGMQVVQGFNTFVRMNNKLLQYVTDTPFYNVYVDISKGGNYNAELCMETANGTQVLCSVNFTVSSPASGGGVGAEAFPAEMKLLFGICCILVAVSCPLMISVKYHVAVPTFVYVVFMAFGIGIGTVLGFLELWLVFLFVVALVAGAVFTIFGHGGQGGGGGGGDSGTIRKGGILSRRGGKDYAGASRKADYGVSPKGSPGYLKGPGRRGY